MDGFPTPVIAFQRTSKGADVSFEGVGPDYVSQLVTQFLGQQEFHFESGDPGNSRWSSGSKAGRLLAGGLAKRARYQVLISQSGPRVQLSFVSQMSGISGSLLGVIREKNQRKAFAAALQSFLAPLLAMPVAPGPTPEIPAAA